MAERQAGKKPAKREPFASSPQDRFSLESTLQSLLEQDLETIAAGKIPDRRLIPHHAIKRDVILRAFEVDFQRLSPSMQDLNREHFDSQLAGIRQLDQHELDKVLATMKEQRTDLIELERHVRAKTKLYSIVDPLF